MNRHGSLHGTGIDPARLAVTPMDQGELVAASLAAPDLGEMVCIPGLDDPAAVEHYHNAARQLLQASGQPWPAATWTEPG